MDLLKNKNVCIIGLGLMGGAYAIGLRKLSPNAIFAYDCNPEVIESALIDGTIDRGESNDNNVGELLEKSHIIISCLYPKLTVDFFTRHMDELMPNAIITDITGVKGILVEELLPHLRDDVDFIMGHPMAGSEKEGYGNATDNIFKGRNYILIPISENKPENIALIKNIIDALGFINIVETTAENHDQKIAFTSQLCHVIACALIDCEDDLKISDYEGGSFSDLTRIAMINTSLWPELFIANQEKLIAQIDKFENSMKAFREKISKSDDEGLKKILSDVRQKRVVMEIDRQNKAKKYEAQHQKNNDSTYDD